VTLLMTAPVKIGRAVYAAGQMATVEEKLGESLLSLGVARRLERAPDGPPINRMVSRAPVVKA